MLHPWVNEDVVAKALARLCRCAGSSESLLLAYHTGKCKSTRRC